MPPKSAPPVSPGPRSGTRLDRLELVAFGHFRGLALDLEAPGMHVIYGKNEAGKSTTLRAIRGLLYGIERDTTDAHVHKMTDLRIGGVLSNGTERLSVVRRKGTSNTLLDAAGQPIDEALLTRLLEGVGRDTFEKAFGLDHVTLRSGGAALLEGRGDVGESLFDASVGGGGEVQRLLRELAAEAERLYAPRASKPLLNEALKALADAKTKIKETERLPQAFVDQEAQIARTKAERDAKVAERAELATKRAVLERASRRVPLERQRAELALRRAELGVIASQAPRLKSLETRQGAYEKALRDARDLALERERLGARVEEAARRAGVPNAAAASRVDALREGRIVRLVHERTALEQRLLAARAEIAKGERERTRHREVALGSKSDVSRLARATERARSLGDAEARCDAAAAKTKRKRVELEARVPALFAGTLEELVRLEVPVLEAVAALETRAEKADRVIVRLEERIAGLDADGAAIARELAEHGGELAPPEPADLANARRDREASWGDPEAYRAAVFAVDALADRMIREADRVTTMARLRSRHAENARQREELVRELTAAAAARSALDDEHRALFRASGLKVGGFGEMRSWLDRRMQLVLASEALADAEAEVEAEAERAKAARIELAAALDAGGDPHRQAEGSTLNALLDEATRRLAAAEAADRAIDEAHRALGKLDAEIEARTAAVHGDETTLVEVQAKLAELVTPLGVPNDASADEVTRALEALRDLFRLADEHAGVSMRAASVESEARAFEDDVKRAVAEVAPDLASLPALEAASVLASRGLDAQKVADALARVEADLASIPADLTLDEELARLAADADLAARTIEDMDGDLDRLASEIHRQFQTIGAQEQGLEAMRAETGAAEAAARAEEALASARAHADRFVRVRLASVILSREIDRYREENQGPMLGHASRLFARLTLGAYASVRAGFDEKDRASIRCVRASGDEVAVDGLSDGTRDQLYLSLRLASLARRAPLPLVLDDILIHFDDDRARAALEVLVEAAASMQVLFFTHHARLVELAKSFASVTFHSLDAKSGAPVQLEL